MTITHDQDNDQEYWSLKPGDMIMIYPDNEIVEFKEHIYDGKFFYKKLALKKGVYDMRTGKKENFRQKVNYNV